MMMRLNEMMEEYWQAGWLVSAATWDERATGAACGRDYRLLLLRGDAVLSDTADRSGSTTSLEQLGVDRETALSVRAFLHAPTHPLAAVVLPNVRKTLLLMPVAGSIGGEGIGLLPRADGDTVGRVLERSLGDRVRWLTARGRALRATRREDEEDGIEQLVENALRLVDHRVDGAKTVTVRNRRELSMQLCAFSELLHAFLDGTPQAEAPPQPFPVAYAFHGTLCFSHVAWMMLCFVVGQRRALSPTRYPVAQAVDHERLLPMIEIKAGNRTLLPSEWRECAAMARQLGMFFDIRRTRSRILVRLCPLVPASEKEFAVRASLRIDRSEKISPEDERSP